MRGFKSQTNGLFVKIQVSSEHLAYFPVSHRDFFIESYNSVKNDTCYILGRERKDRFNLNVPMMIEEAKTKYLEGHRID